MQTEILRDENNMPYVITHNFNTVLPATDKDTVLEKLIDGYSSFNYELTESGNYGGVPYSNTINVYINTDLIKQAEILLQDLKIDFNYKSLGVKNHFGDGHYRPVYKCTFTRDSEKITVDFGQSVGSTEFPRPYDLLACITKNDPIDFENFCWELGYDEDSRKAEKTFKAVQKEWEQVSNFFTTEELSLLQNIQ